MIIPYDASKEDRDRIVAEREKRLYQSFENMRQKIDEQIQTMNFSTVSEKVKRQQLEEIRHSLQKELQSHYNALESGLKDDMVNIGQQVLNESETFYKGLNMPIGMSITSFPVEIMNNIVNGSVYQEKWYLSKALWGDYTEKLDQINEVLTQGVGLNLSSLEIAKQLEQYVDPAAMHPSKTIVTPCLQDPVTGKLYSMDYVKRHPEKDWSGFKEKNSYFRYGKVDYNAQRLARTLINHAYQQNVVQQAKANPFAKGVKWLASGGERMCEICEERDGKIFPVDEVPLDHPNGMCTFSVVTDLSMMQMSDVLADFVNGVPTDYDDKLYDWYNQRAVNAEQKHDKKVVVDIKEEIQKKIDSVKELANNGAATIEDFVEVGKLIIDNSGYNEIAEINKERNDIFRQIADAKLGMTFSERQAYEESEGKILRKKQMELHSRIKEKWDNGRMFVNVLSKYRKFGFDKELQKSIENHLPGKSPRKGIVKEAYTRYPTSWIKYSVDRGRIYIGTKKRGYYNGFEIFLSGATDNSYLNTAIHEVGHRMEDVVPKLGKYTDDFYKKRTDGIESVWLGSGYGKHEVTKRDGFVNSYMGKEYDYANMHEILSMGYQYMFDPEGFEDFNDMMRRDREMANWLAGLIVCVGD